MAPFRLTILGAPALLGAEGPVPLPGTKALALLLYLAAQPDRVFARAHVGALLWEEADEAGGRNSLSTTLTRLRQALPVWPIQTTPETIAWDPRAGIIVDAVEFLERVRAGRHTEAVNLWRGSFLEGFEVPNSEGYEEWLRQERRSWEGRMLELLGALADAAEAAGDWATLASHSRRALGIDALQERFHRLVMIASFRLGDRAAALAQYSMCRRLLVDELGIEPDKATTALRDALLEGALPDAPMPPMPKAEPHSMAAPYPPLVGRDRPLTQLRQSLNEAVTGRGRVVVLQGPAGIGKSRLVEELLWTIRRGEGTPAARTVLVGRCHESAHGLPYAPFVEALGAILPTLDLGRLKVADIWLAEVNRLLPDLALLRPGLPVPPTLDPAQEQRRLFEGLARFLAGLPQPALIVLEDLHWADEATQLFLAYLARQLPITQEIAILVTSRTGDLEDGVGRLVEELHREGRLSWLDLEPLSAQTLHSLVQVLTGKANQPLGDRLFSETQGNPLFAVELVRELQESAALERLAPESLREFPLPRTVQGLIQGRIGRLPQGARDLVTAASILPRPVSPAVLEQIAGLGEEQFLLALERSVQAGLLTETVAGEVVFGHDLIRRAVLGRVSQARRQYLHRKAFFALQVTGSPRLAEELAMHAIGAGLWREGDRWCREAATAALRVFAYAVATRYYEEALACLEKLPPEPEIQVQAIDLRLQLGQLSLYFQPGRLEGWLAPAAEAAQALGDQARLTQVRLAQAGAWYIQGRLRAAMGALAEVLPSVRAAGSTPMLAPCLSLLGEVMAACGEYESARTTLAEAVELQNQQGNHLEAAVVRNMLAGVIAYQGDFQTAESMLAEQLKRSRSAGDAAALASTLGFMATVAQIKGDWAQAISSGQEAIRLAEESENLVHQYVPRVFLGLAMARQGDVAGGLTVQQQAVDLARTLGTRLLLGQALGWLGAILLLAGRPAEAQSAAREGLKIAEEEGAQFDGALCIRVLGEIAMATGEAIEAERLISGALERFTRMGHQPEIARCHTLLGRKVVAAQIVQETGLCAL